LILKKTNKGDEEVTINKRKKVDTALNMLEKAGVFNISRLSSPRHLTVLNYHRINDIDQEGFDTFIPNVSATPAEFERQMDHVRKHYNVISCETLCAWLEGKEKLPSYSAMVTFDDGYEDNYSNAYPVLKTLKVPAIIFLTSDYIGKKEPFYWDYAAYCFQHTKKNSAELPFLGAAALSNEAGRQRVLMEWIEKMKLQPEIEKQQAVAELGAILEVSPTTEAFSGLTLSWEQVREMGENGIEMGSHTASHPILTRIPPSQVEEELARSKKKIEAETGRRVRGFAYPNGHKADFSEVVMGLVRKTGYDAAFTLMRGVCRYAEVKKEPLTIRRIFIGASDSFSKFTTKLAAAKFMPGD
jgi:peptidoglycan/xylan/chitin deacetylase (PgdA/CDA1 family)